MNLKIVIKIGTTSIASDNDKGINLQLISKLVESIVNLKKLGHDVILVSSGAIGLGSKHLNFKQKPSKITDKQVSASVGQILLASLYNEFFQKHNLKVHLLPGLPCLLHIQRVLSFFLFDINHYPYLEDHHEPVNRYVSFLLLP